MISRKDVIIVIGGLVVFGGLVALIVLGRLGHLTPKTTDTSTKASTVNTPAKLIVNDASTVTPPKSQPEAPKVIPTVTSTVTPPETTIVTSTTLKCSSDSVLVDNICKSLYTDYICPNGYIPNRNATEYSQLCIRS